MNTIPENISDDESSAIQVSRPQDGVVVITIISEPLGVLRHTVKRALMRTLEELEQDTSIQTFAISARKLAGCWKMITGNQP
jgi:ABC-type molybdate transport system ATPase subunit